MAAIDRYLIVNADDFGLSSGVNRGILEAHRRGIVTRASLMVRQPAAGEAVAMARDFPQLSLGLHLDLGEWAYRSGEWKQLYVVVDISDPDAVHCEVKRQFDRFCDLTGRAPTHLDSHQHVHRQEPVHSAMQALSSDYALPLRHFSSDIQYCGSFYGQTSTGKSLPESVGVESLLSILTDLPWGVTELACHPGCDEQLDTMYRLERKCEVEALCNERVRSELSRRNVKLKSFHSIVSASLFATTSYANVRSALKVQQR